MQQSIDRRGIKQIAEFGIESPGACRRMRNIALLSALLVVVYVTSVSAQEVEGKDLGVFYQQNCAKCHGPDGSGVSAEKKKLSGRDLTDPNWQRDTTDDKMMKTILKGKFFGLAMPRYKGTLTEGEVQRMVSDIIRKSKKGEVIVSDAKRRSGK